MSGWIVYSKDGSLERCKLRSLEYGGTAMGERAVTATFDFHSEVAFEVFDYIEYRGERFELEAVPTVKKLSSFEYQYELRFVSLKYELERCEMRDLVPSDNGVVYPTPLTFSFTGDVRYLTDRIQACLDAMYGAGVWKITIAEGTSSEEKNITIAQQNCWNALALVNSTYGLNFYIKGRTITIGGEQPLVSHTFEYGKGNGLYEIERASDTETGIVTKLRAYGSTRNLDYSYPKKPEWSDSVLPVSFALSPLRLMLPSFKTDGKTDYVLADDAAIAKYGIREASMVYDDIYPSIAGATYNGQAIDEIKSVDAVDESQKTFVVYFHDLGFDLEEHLTTSDAQISMKSGALQGYTFTISSIEKQTGGYKITLGKNSLENSEESGAYVPGVNWNMKAGDKFVLLNILMPQKYIRDAENRLLARANEYLAQYSKTNFSYNIGLHDKFLIQNPSVYDSLIEGSKLKVYDKEIGIDEEVTIQSITITENLEDNILPQVKVTLNNEPSASTLDRIQGKLNEVAAETAANGFTTQSEIMAQYRRKLDKPFFDKLFVAIDANGNEIPSTDVITPIAYIKAKYHVASVGGFTMYAMDKDIDIPSLASGLPFDGRTIWYNPDTQQIEVIGGTGGGSGEGVSNFWDLSGIPSWITNSKPKYSYSEIEGTPDLSVYAQVNALKAYVTLAGAQTLTGEKNFTGGLKVNGSPIIYDSANKYWKLQGNLVLTGGITMYADDGSVELPSLYDGLPIDGTTIYWETDEAGNRVLKAVGGGGTAESVAWSNITGKPSWIGSSKPTYTYSEIQNTPDLSLYAKKTDIPSLSGYATESWVKQQNYAIKATTLSGYGITDAYTKTNVDDLLKSYVTLGGTPQTITGEKNFTGGLKVNGSLIYYDTEKKYWKLEGDLLVTGGVTMYGSDSSFTPSTIMDAILYDSATLGINSNGQLYVKGGTSGGGLDITALQNYLTSNSYLNVTSGDNRYLQLSGGTIVGNTNPLTLRCQSGTFVRQLFQLGNNTVSGIGKTDTYTFLTNFVNGSIATEIHLHDNGNFTIYSNNVLSTIWHSGNDGSGSGLDADLLDGYHAMDFTKTINRSVDDFLNFTNKARFQAAYLSGQGDFCSLVIPTWSSNTEDNWYLSELRFAIGGNPKFRMSHNGSVTSDWREFAFTDSNVASATKLQTARTIWGQSFDGTKDVTGNLNLGYNRLYIGNGTDNYFIGMGADNMYAYHNYYGHYFTSRSGEVIRFDGSGNVGIGTTSPAYKLDVNGTIRFASKTIWGQSFDGTGNVSGNMSGVSVINSFIKPTLGTSSVAYLHITNFTSTQYDGVSIYVANQNNSNTSRPLVLQNGYGNVGIGVDSPSQKLHVDGNLKCNIIYGTNLYANTGGEGLYISGSGIYYHNSSSSWVSDLMYFTSDGNVGIGTGNPTYKLHVEGTMYGDLKMKTPRTIWGQSFDGTGNVSGNMTGVGTVNSFLNIKQDNSSVSHLFLTNPTSNVDYGHIYVSNYDNSRKDRPLALQNGFGNVGIGLPNPSAKLHVSGDILATGGITMYSMRKLKNVVDERGLSLSELSTIKPTRYTWKDGRDNRLHFGGIADDIQQVLPEVVYSTSDGILTMDYGNAAFAVASSLIQPVVDHEKRIAMLEEENKQLRQEVELLKAS